MLWLGVSAEMHFVSVLILALVCTDLIFKQQTAIYLSTVNFATQFSCQQKKAGSDQGQAQSSFCWHDA